MSSNLKNIGGCELWINKTCANHQVFDSVHCLVRSHLRLCCGSAQVLSLFAFKRGAKTVDDSPAVPLGAFFCMCVYMCV